MADYEIIRNPDGTISGQTQVGTYLGRQNGGQRKGQGNTVVRNPDGSINGEESSIDNPPSPENDKSEFASLNMTKKDYAIMVGAVVGTCVVIGIIILTDGAAMPVLAFL